MLAAFGAPLPDVGEPAADVVDLLARHAGRGASACASPRYFGYHEIFHACTIVAAICHFVAIALVTLR